MEVKIIMERLIKNAGKISVVCFVFTLFILDECHEKVGFFIVCFENPGLRTGSQKETLALSCFLCLLEKKGRGMVVSPFLPFRAYYISSTSSP